MTARDYIAHRVEVGDIKVREGEVLQKLASIIEKDLKGEEVLEKEAGFFGSIKDGINTFRASPAITSVAIGTGLAGATMAARGIKKLLVDPVTEEYRFRKMRDLPGLNIDIRDPSQNRFYVDRDLDDDEARRQIIRKSFGMLHDFAPEISRSPELSAEIIQQSVDSDPTQLYDRAVGMADGTARLNKGRMSREPNPFWYDDVKGQLNAQFGVKTPEQMQSAADHARKVDFGNSERAAQSAHAASERDKFTAHREELKREGLI